MAARAYIFIACACACLFFTAAPTGAEPGDLAPTWAQEVDEAESYLAGEEAKLSEEREALKEYEAEGDILVDSQRERVEDYEARVAGARAWVEAARAGSEKQAELDRKNEPQDQLREVKESIAYYETLRNQSQAAGDTANAETAEEELEGGYFAPGLYELQEKAEKVRAAKETAKDAATLETTGEATAPEETAAAAPPGDGGGGENQPAEGPEPAPEEPAPEEPDEAPAGDGPGFAGFLGDVNITPILVFLALAAGCVFALSRAAGLNVRGFFSWGPAMASHGQKPKKTKPKNPKRPKTKAAAKAAGPEPPKHAPNLEDGPEREPRPEPGAGDDGREPNAGELDEIFGFDRGPEEEQDDGNPPD